MPKMPKRAKTKWNGVINQSIFNTENVDAQKKATNQPKSTVELGYMCPRGLSGPSAKTLTKQVKYK